MDSIYNYTRDDLKDRLTQQGFPPYAAQQILGWLYQKRVGDPEMMTNLSKKTRAFLRERFEFALPLEYADKRISSDGTVKFLFVLKERTALPTGQAGIESVLMYEPKRVTFCVSTQAGCSCGCVFCASSKKGFVRNLSPAEITGQYLFAEAFVRENAPGKPAASRLATGEPSASQGITNVVFMGMGEPLNNLANVAKTISLLTDASSIGLGKHRICISTCGVVPGIKELTRLGLGVKLSVSLNAVTDEKRSRIMPINRQYPLKELLAACRAFMKISRFPVTFEYVLFGGFNMSRADAQGLSMIVKSLKAKINFIPFNPCLPAGRAIKDVVSSTQDNLREPSSLEIGTFLSCMDKKLFYSLRKSKGRDIHAACGNLSLQLTQEINNL